MYFNGCVLLFVSGTCSFALFLFVPRIHVSSTYILNYYYMNFYFNGFKFFQYELKFRGVVFDKNASIDGDRKLKAENNAIVSNKCSTII